MRVVILFPLLMFLIDDVVTMIQIRNSHAPLKNVCTPHRCRSYRDCSWKLCPYSSQIPQCMDYPIFNGTCCQCKVGRTPIFHDFKPILSLHQGKHLIQILNVRSSKRKIKDTTEDSVDDLLKRFIKA